MDKLQLVERCRSGDRDAFGILYRTYFRAMGQVVSRYIHDADVMQDILHDGFVIAFTSINTLREGTKIEAWLTTIMKNLSLRYLKGRSAHIYVPLSNITPADAACVQTAESPDMTWDELKAIIGRLPEGYGNVFRLAVLDGLSHKEIGALLGIAPHSSSSQLSHAKAMLRRMIRQYRVEMGILSVIGILSVLWHGLFRQHEDNQATPATRPNRGDEIAAVTDSITDGNSGTDSTQTVSKIISKPVYRPNPCQLPNSNTTEQPPQKDDRNPVDNGNTDNDTIMALPRLIERGVFMAREKLSYPSQHKPLDWSVSLAYSGNIGQNGLNHYRIPDPGLPDAEGPSNEIEITERAHHHMPLVIGVTLGRSLTPRWSVETGVRYTFLRSDINYESEHMNKETINRIHYIGVPLKLNYNILVYNGLSLYGHGGAALDIPVKAYRHTREYSPELENPTIGITDIDAPIQWSVEAGLGIQYDFTPSLSIYAEPSLRYYFNSDGDIRTIRQDKPLEFTIPVGLRLSL